MNTMNNMNKNGTLKKSQANSAKKANDGVSNLLNILTSNLGDENSRGNASTIYNIAKLLA